MYDEQPVLPPVPMVRLPQIPPRQVTTRRQKYARPVLTRYTVKPMPVTPRPNSLPYPSFVTRLPDTPPIASPRPPVTRTPSPRNTGTASSAAKLYIPRGTRHREPGIGESLMGCALLLLTAAIVLILLYYLSMPG